jgi:hypothetical protein
MMRKCDWKAEDVEKQLKDRGRSSKKSLEVNCHAYKKRRK